mmetsp:Transcript_42581/g.109975  ORF Transcript_42581/g.109975 Transcript_42581/m.109975 type:complete len:213 (-) Transcript_42581:2-640(-)
MDFHGQLHLQLAARGAVALQDRWQRRDRHQAAITGAERRCDVHERVEDPLRWFTVGPTYPQLVQHPVAVSDEVGGAAARSEVAAVLRPPRQLLVQLLLSRIRRHRRCQRRDRPQAVIAGAELDRGRGGGRGRGSDRGLCRLFCCHLAMGAWQQQQEQGLCCEPPPQVRHPWRAHLPPGRRRDPARDRARGARDRAPPQSRPPRPPGIRALSP